MVDFWKTFFVSQSLTNALSLPLNSSISFKHVFYGCKRLRRPKKHHLKPDSSGSISQPHAGKGQIPHSPGTEDSQMPVVFPGGGMLKFRFDRRIKALANGFNICFNILSILLNGNVESVCHPLSTALKRVETMLNQC